MTNPTDEPGFLLRMILDKLDRLDRKLDVEAESRVAQRADINQLRKEVDEIKADDRAERAATAADDKSDRAVRRANVLFALTTLVAVAAIVVPLITK